ncbi:MAG: hypothetical protein JW951_00215 [Lentisphaerae bacterium]|nr:hypothetical protein [Lentisphaerota bacterium]
MKSWLAFLFKYLVLLLAGAIVIAAAITLWQRGELPYVPPPPACDAADPGRPGTAAPLPEPPRTPPAPAQTPPDTPAPSTPAAAPRPQNPHSEALARAEDVYRAFLRKAQSLERQRDSAEGAERMAAIEALHRMKFEQEELANAYRKAKADYDAWQEANPTP